MPRTPPLGNWRPGKHSVAAADAEAEPLGAAEVDRLFEPLLDYNHLGLAVSGGSDSVALMVLASGWRERRPGAPKLSVLCVDHGLRAEAAREAVQVSDWASGLGLPHAVLQWAGDKPNSGLQAAARQARYDLMAAWCVRNQAQTIVTGHTLDDQAETVLMRLGRGSGVDGLSGMPVAGGAPWPLIRPFLAVSRVRLRASLRQIGHGWIDDPSNDDSGFERVRVRRALAVLGECGVDAKAIARSAERLARARQALEQQAFALHETAVSEEADGRVLIELDAFRRSPAETRIRLLQMVLHKRGGQAALRLAALERLDGWLMDGGGRARTLGNCRISRRKRAIVVAREPGRSKPARQHHKLDP